jgi:ABC-type Mn2+/Zn2+ transport system ATPase subunit
VTLPSIIECRGLSTGYGAETVLENVSLRIPEGTLLPLVGPNGSGKSTLLKTFVGLIPLKGGTFSARFQGGPPAYVPQQRRIDPLFPVSVEEIIRMGLYGELGFWRRCDPSQKERVQNTLDRFGLTAHRSKPFGELSGGMKQKTLLGRAFVSNARVFILDEPFSGLDANSERYVMAHILELNRTDGRTILLAHHRLEDLSMLADRVCLVDRKTARVVGAAEAVERISSVPVGGGK